MGLFNFLQAQSTELIKPETLQQELDQLVESNKVPGIIAAVIDGKSIKQLAVSGIREYGQESKLTTEDKFHIGSCTKAMTSFMLNQLVDEGKLDWNSTILDVFPELADSIHTDYHSKTLHDYVTHTAGLPANAKNWMEFKEDKLVDRRTKILISNLKKPSNVDGYLYSNLGYMIAGHMAEKVTGHSWEELMQVRIFDTLNMTSAGFGPPGTQDSLVQPKGHTKSLFGKKWNSYFLDNDPALGPAGTVHCNIEDWATYIQTQFFQSDDVIEHFLLQPKLDDYACGWAVVEREWAKGNAYTHSGSNTVWTAVAWVAPNIDRAYLVMTNAHGSSMGLTLDGLIGKMIKQYSEY